MNQAVAIDAIEERLRALVLDSDLGREARIQAERYLARLTSPVRVTLFGRDEVGKRRILETAAGRPILPGAPSVPMLELRFGQMELTQITYADGSVTEHLGDVSPDHLEGAVVVAIEAPRPILRRISMLDVFAEDSIPDHREAIEWAATRTDIAIWCTERFDTLDQAIWNEIPDRIHDHAYLVLTGREASDEGGLPAHLAEAFLDVCGINPKLAIGEDGVDVVINRLVSHAELGREADADSALLFVKKLETMPAARGNSGLRPTTRPRTRPLSRPLTKPAPAADAAEAGAEKTRTPTTPIRRQTRPRTRPLGSPDALPKRQAAPEEHRDVMRTGLGYLRRRAQALLDDLRRESGGTATDIPAICGETLQHLGDLLSSADDTHSEAITQLSDAVMDAENVVILMENEDGPGVAADAVGILLQVRQDIEAALAA
ncbi:hypothetical protein [Ovoidimarina sediminis]|uniref:hypothetical protein n=1 Tax=Ovoidimarina sediminis TaxID=3079856 RepID=UPI00290A6413|nr:hypothetical protein [Rhodophyticola sp. MJ-SS7]MDU8943349.1 hypothetical protein [Rhodophyticola sp. MJ-SS7]